MQAWPTGIFASIDGGLGAGIESVKKLGVPTVQLSAPSASLRTTENCAATKAQFSEAGIEISVVFIGFPEDDYQTVEHVVQTVGLVPPGTRQERLRQTLEIADFTAALGVDAIGMHLGFVPGEPTDTSFQVLVDMTRIVCDHCQSQGQFFHLETGQETADELLCFIEAVERDQLKVNFDPANMILYGAGNPLEALDKVGAHVRSVHCKDACVERRADQPWYEDAPLGTGDVDIEAFLRKLHSLGYTGPLTIEREYSPDQAGDIAQALQLLETLRTKILG